MGTRSAWVVVALGLVSWGCAASGDIEDDQNAGQGGTTGGGTGGQSGVGGSGGQAGAGQGGSAGAAGAGGGTGGTAGAAAAGGTSGSAAGGAGASGGAAGSGGASGSGGAAGGSGGSAAGGTSGTAGSGGTAPTEGLVVTGLTGSIAIRGVNLGAGWVTESLAQETESGCAVTAGRLGGLVVMRATGNKLRYMTVDTAGNWTSPADVGSGTTRATPAATTTANGTHRLVFHGDDFKYYSADYSGGAWAGSFTNVGSPQAYGPLPVSIAARDAAYAIAYKGDNTRLITQAFSGVWDPSGTDQGAGTTLADYPPAIAGRSADYVVVFARSSDRTLQWISGVNGGTWSAPQAVGGPATDRSFAITATDSGDIVLAWVSALDQSLYAGRLTGSSWSVAQVDSFGQQGSPALAPGIDGHDAELVFLRGSAIEHTSLTGTTWSAPMQIASGALSFVGLARMKW